MHFNSGKGRTKGAYLENKIIELQVWLTGYICGKCRKLKIEQRKVL